MSKNIYALGVKNLIASLFSQAVVLVTGMVLSFALPAFMGIEQFGFWQVYLLYVTFAMIFGLGFTDGIYLRYGSYNYDQLPYEKMRSTLRFYFMTAVFFTAVVFLLSFFERNENKQFAFMAASLNIFLLLLSNAAVSVLQFTNRIREYSFIVALGKLMLLVLVVALLFFGVKNFRGIILVDLFTKAVLLTLNIILVRKVFFGKAISFREGIKDWFQNITSGSKMMLAVYASTFVLNIGRIVIERFEGIKVYSSYAFAVSISSFFLVFVTASSLSFFPLLKRVDQLKLPSIYQKTNRFLFFISFIMLGFYYPLTYIINHWFPDYHAVIQYFPLFMIMTMMQGKEHFLHTVYLKALRQESRLLLYNTVFSILAAAVVIPVYFMTRSVYAVALATCILIITKSYSFEIYLRRKQLFLKTRNIQFEIILIVLYAVATIFMERYYSLALYLIVAVVYFIILYSFIISYLKRIFREFRKR